MCSDDEDVFYAVYLVISAGMPRDHVAIFVETHELGLNSGYIFQVSGNIQQGMYYNHRAGPRPEDDCDSAFISRKLLGQVRKVDYETGLFRQICDSIPAPPMQLDGPKRMNRNKPLRRCNEWTWDVVALLRENEILVEQGAQSSTS